MDLIEAKLGINRHPWELSRANSILKIINTKPSNFQYADVGAGDQFFTNRILKYTNRLVWAVDIQYGAPKINEKILEVKSIDELPDGGFDCVILMDLIEHVGNDFDFLGRLLRKIKAKGEIIVTVPAFNVLFSSNDIFYKHYRRYNRTQLIRVLRSSGFEIKECFYFFSLLFFARLITILITRVFSFKPMRDGLSYWQFTEKDIITKMVTVVLDVDFAANRLLGKFCIFSPGLSLCAICSRKNFN